MTTQSAHSIYRRCHDETIGLAAVAFHALRSDSRLEQTDISDAILTQYFPNEEMLRRFVATHGIVRPWCINEAVTDARLSYSTTIRFAHQCYYEYYAALYIVETLSAHSSDVTSAHIADIYNALADTAPHLVRVRLIAVGLSVLPEYIRSADSVCRTIIDTNRPFTTSDLRIGVHEYHRHLRRHAGIVTS